MKVRVELEEGDNLAEEQLKKLEKSLQETLDMMFKQDTQQLVNTLRNIEDKLPIGAKIFINGDKITVKDDMSILLNRDVKNLASVKGEATVYFEDSPNNITLIIEINTNREMPFKKSMYYAVGTQTAKQELMKLFGKK